MDLTTDQPNVMELSLPSSTDSTRPGTPTVTNCERLHDITTDIKKFGIVIENIQSTIRALHLNGINDDNDPTLMDQSRRLQEYQRLQHLAVSEFRSQPPCDTPGCTIHHTPSNSPTKSKKLETLKTPATKRKDNEDGFTSPSNRQIAKNRRTSSQTELNFKIDLRNKFQNLKIDQVAGPSSSTNGATHTNSNQRNIINSIVRPIVSYAQAANNSAPSNTSNSNNRQQMAPLAKGNPATKTPTQASRVLAPPPQPVNANTNPNLVLINQTLQGIIQALSTLAQQINTLNFSENSQTNNSKKSKQAKKRELHALVEAIIDDDE
ncbi:hypothetical protein TNIN_221941 [Trichonephila inaurata madagascariensis]|uniref:Uncharacterized protein n=1 Tax=Trichonephila inaurata madagascariensis TaxID=2747483 RepID=A0A8X7BX52_9ARAC|nr:hypothetical protein TNIN_221941 [Trichonephila inaurata madagascariensis]